MARILCCGTSRARCVAAPSAPRSTSGKPKLASSAATRMSALPTRPMPAPRDKSPRCTRLPVAKLRRLRSLAHGCTAHSTRKVKHVLLGVSMRMEHVPIFMRGRVVLISGGTRGIGRAIAEGFLAAGADVLVCARKPPEQPIAAREPDATARERVAEFVSCDVREPAQIDAVVAAARER